MLPGNPQHQSPTPAELEFQRVLAGAVAGRWTILRKVTLGDLAGGQEGAPGPYAHFDQVGQKQVDFVLCDLHITSPVLAIELEEPGPKGAQRQRQDDLVERVLHSAGIPLLRVPLGSAYDEHQLSTLIQKQIERYHASIQPTLPIGGPLPQYVEQSIQDAHTPTGVLKQPRKPMRLPRVRRQRGGLLDRFTRRLMMMGLRLVLLLLLAGAAFVFISSVDWRASLGSIFTLPNFAPGQSAGDGNNQEPPATGVTATVSSAGLNMRSGPGTNHPPIKAYTRGTELQVLARDGSGSWLKVRAPDGQEGWMSTGFLRVNGSLDEVPQRDQ